MEIKKNGCIVGNEFNETQQNFTVVGSPTLSDSILSNTSKNNYVSFTINNDTTEWEIDEYFTVQTISQSYNAIISRGSPGFQAYLKKGNTTLTLELNGSLAMITHNITVGHSYKIVLNSHNGVLTSTLTDLNDNTEQSGTYNLSLSISGTWRLGITQSGNYGFDGSIDLSRFLLKLNDKLSYSPALNIGLSDYQIVSEEFYEI